LGSLLFYIQKRDARGEIEKEELEEKRKVPN
jgi:hypothetical protein